MTRLTTSPARDEKPAWSPDGGTIAFFTDRDGSPSLYAVDPATGEERPLTGPATSGLNPSWGPDGRGIAFNSETSTGFHIEVGATGADRQAVVEPLRSGQSGRPTVDGWPTTPTTTTGTSRRLTGTVRATTAHPTARQPAPPAT